MFLIQVDIDCGTHLCTGWCFCPGLPLLTLFFHTCRGQREQQGQLKWKHIKYISMHYMKRLYGPLTVFLDFLLILEHSITFIY